MIVKVDLGQAGKADIIDVQVKDISFVEYADVEELFYGLSDKEQKKLVMDYLDGLSNDELIEIVYYINMGGIK